MSNTNPISKDSLVDALFNEGCTTYSNYIHSIENEIKKLVFSRDKSTTKQENILSSLSHLNGSENLIEELKNYSCDIKDYIYALHIPQVNQKRQKNPLSEIFTAKKPKIETMIDAKREAYVLQRMSFLKKKGLWSSSRLPKIKEIDIPLTHSNYLHDEIIWMAVDFAEEKKWKKSAAKKFAYSCKAYLEARNLIKIKEQQAEEFHKMKLANTVASFIRKWWADIKSSLDKQESTDSFERWSSLVNKNEKFLYQLSDVTPSWLSGTLENDISDDEEWNPKTNLSHSSSTSASDDFNEGSVKSNMSVDQVDPDMDTDSCKMEESSSTSSNETQSSECETSEDVEMLVEDSNKDIIEIVNEIKRNKIQSDIEMMSSKHELIKNLLLDNEKNIEDILPSGFLQSNPIIDAGDSKVRRSSRLNVSSQKITTRNIESFPDEKESTASFECNTSSTDDSTRDSFYSVNTPSKIEIDDHENEVKFANELRKNESTLLVVTNDQVKYAKYLHQYKYFSNNQDCTMKQEECDEINDFIKSNEGQKYNFTDNPLCRMACLPNETLKKCYKWLRCCYMKNLPCFLLGSSEFSLDPEIALITHLSSLVSVHDENGLGNWGPHLIITTKLKIPFWRYVLTSICPGLSVHYLIGDGQDPLGTSRRLKRQIDSNKTHVVVASYAALREKPYRFYNLTWSTLTLHMIHLFYSNDPVSSDMPDRLDESSESRKEEEEMLIKSEVASNASDSLKRDSLYNKQSNTFLSILNMIKIKDQRIIIGHKELPMFGENKNLVANFLNLPFNNELPVYDLIDWFKFRFDDEEEDWDNLVLEEEIQCPLTEVQSSKHELILQSKKGQKAIKHGNLLEVLSSVNECLTVCNHPILLEKSFKLTLRHLGSLYSGSLEDTCSFQLKLDPVWLEEEKLLFSNPSDCLKEIHKLREERNGQFTSGLLTELILWNRKSVQVIEHDDDLNESQSKEENNSNSGTKRPRLSNDSTESPNCNKGKRRKINSTSSTKTDDEERDPRNDHWQFLTHDDYKSVNFEISLSNSTAGEKTEENLPKELDTSTPIVKFASSVYTLEGCHFFSKELSPPNKMEQFMIEDIVPKLVKRSPYREKVLLGQDTFSEVVTSHRKPSQIEDVEKSSGKLIKIDFILDSLLKTDDSHPRSRIILLISHRQDWMELVEVWLRAKQRLVNQPILVLNSHQSINTANQWPRSSKGPLIALMNGRLSWSIMCNLKLSLEDSVIILDTDWRVQVNDSLRNKLHGMALCGLTTESAANLFSSSNGSTLPLLRVYRLYSVQPSQSLQFPCVETNLVTTGVTRLLPSSVFVILNKFSKINSKNNHKNRIYRELLSSRVLPNVVQLFFCPNRQYFAGSHDAPSCSTTSSVQNIENTETMSNNENESITSVANSIAQQILNENHSTRSAHVPLENKLLKKVFDMYESSQDQQLYSLSLAEQTAQELELTEELEQFKLFSEMEEKENYFNAESYFREDEVSNVKYWKLIADEYQRFLGFRDTARMLEPFRETEEQLCYSVADKIIDDSSVWVPVGFDASKFNIKVDEENSVSKLLARHGNLCDMFARQDAQDMDASEFRFVLDYDPDPMLDSELPKLYREGNSTSSSTSKRMLLSSNSQGLPLMGQNTVKRRKFTASQSSQKTKIDPASEEYLSGGIASANFAVGPTGSLNTAIISLTLVWYKDGDETVCRTFIVPRASYHKPELTIGPRSERIRRFMGSQGSYSSSNSNCPSGYSNNNSNYPNRFLPGSGSTLPAQGNFANHPTNQIPSAGSASYQQFSYHNNSQILTTNLPTYIQNQLPRDPAIVFSYCSSIGHLINSMIFHRYLIIPFAYKLNVAAASMAMNKQFFNVPTSQSSGTGQTAEYPLIASDGPSSLAASLQHPYAPLNLPGINLGSGPDWTAVEESALFYAITHLQGIPLDVMISMPKISRSFLHTGLTTTSQNTLSTMCINFRLVEFFLNSFTPVRSYRSSKQCLAVLTRIHSMVSSVNSLSPSNFESANTELNNCLSNAILMRSNNQSNSSSQSNLASHSGNKGQSANSQSSTGQMGSNTNLQAIGMNQTNAMTGRKVKNKMKSTYAAIMNAQTNAEMDMMIGESSHSTSGASITQSTSLNASLLHRFKSLSFFDRLQKRAIKEEVDEENNETDVQKPTSQEAMCGTHIKALANEMITVQRTLSDMFSHVIKDKTIGPGGKQIIGLYDESLSLLHHQIQSNTGGNSSTPGSTTNYHYRLSSNSSSPSTGSGVRRSGSGHATIMARSIQGSNIVASSNNPSIISSSQMSSTASGQSSGPMIAKNLSHIAALQEYSINPDTLITPAMVIKNKEEREARLKHETNVLQQNTNILRTPTTTTSNTTVQQQQQQQHNIPLIPAAQSSAPTINVISNPSTNSMRWINSNTNQTSIIQTNPVGTTGFWSNKNQSQQQQQQQQTYSTQNSAQYHLAVSSASMSVINRMNQPLSTMSSSNVQQQINVPLRSNIITSNPGVGNSAGNISITRASQPQGTTTVIGLPQNYSFRPAQPGQRTSIHATNQIRRNVSASNLSSGQVISQNGQNISIIGTTNPGECSNTSSIRLASRQTSSNIVTGSIPMQQYNQSHSQIYQTSQNPQILRTKQPIRSQIRPQTFLRTITSGNNNTNIIQATSGNTSGQGMSRTVNIAVSSVLTQGNVSLSRPIQQAMIRPMGQMMTTTQILTRPSNQQSFRPTVGAQGSVPNQATIIPGSQVLLSSGQVQIYPSTNVVKTKSTNPHQHPPTSN